MNDDSSTSGTFWEHLDQLRGSIWRIVVAVTVAACVAFCFKDALFAAVLAPKHDTFVTYRLLSRVAQCLVPDAAPPSFAVELISTRLAGQFLMHVRIAIFAGMLAVAPYILFELFRFVSPALYEHERRYATRVVAWGYVMFIAGLMLSYFLIFPLTFRFLGTYQVSAEVSNCITLDSYIDTLIMLSFMIGIVFEMPILCWLFAKLGFLTAAFMRRYRRHAIVVLLIIAAVITPTSDVVTLLLVAMPMYLLYEAGILVVARTPATK